MTNECSRSLDNDTKKLAFIFGVENIVNFLVKMKSKHISVSSVRIKRVVIRTVVENLSAKKLLILLR